MVTLETRQPTDRARDAILALCPESQRDAFSALIELGLSRLAPDQLNKLATDLESANTPDGVDVEKLVEVGKAYGLTSEMINEYQRSGNAQDSR